MGGGSVQVLTHYRASVIKIVSYWHMNKQTSHGTEYELQEQIYNYMWHFRKGGITNIWGKGAIFNKQY